MAGLGLADYEPIIGVDAIEELRALARPLRGITVLHVNSTRAGGGVAEMLERLVPLMGELGLRARWDVIEGDAAFFATTKKFHNAIQGQPVQVTDAELRAYLAERRRAMGEAGHEHVRRNFLITRNLRDCLLMIHALFDLKRRDIDLSALAPD